MEQIRTNTGVDLIPTIIQASGVDLTNNKTLGARALARLNAKTGGRNKAGEIIIKERVLKNLEVVFTALVASADLEAGVEVEMGEDTKNLLIGDTFEFGGMQIRVLERAIQDETTGVWSAKIKMIRGVAEDIPADTTLPIVSNLQIEGDNRNKGSRGVAKTNKYKTYTQIIKGSGRITSSEISEIIAKYGNQMTAQGEAEVKDILYRQALTEFTNNVKGLALSKFAFEEEVFIDNENKPMRQAGGLTYFARNTFDKNGDVVAVRTDNAIDKGGNALTMKDINTAFKFALENNGTLNTIAGGIGQMMNISGLSGADTRQFYDKDGKVIAGKQVIELISPLVVDGNSIKFIEIAPELGKTVVMYDRNTISIETVAGSNLTKYQTPNDLALNEYRLTLSTEAFLYVENITNSFFFFDDVSDELI